MLFWRLTSSNKGEQTDNNTLILRKKSVFHEEIPENWKIKFTEHEYKTQLVLDAMQHAKHQHEMGRNASFH